MFKYNNETIIAEKKLIKHMKKCIEYHLHWIIEQSFVLDYEYIYA